jgi:hypothetical protein
MRKLILFVSLFLSGCSFVPNIPSFKTPSTEPISKAAAVVTRNEQAEEALSKLAASEAKAEAEKAKLIAEYSKVKEEMTKAYNDLKEKDYANFAKISELNYGVYHVTQEKKKTDINTTIAHLRSKEIMLRTDKLTDAEKEVIQKEVADEKQKTVDQLYIKYKQTIELAVNQKAALDTAEHLVEVKEQEKAKLREENRIQIELLQKQKLAEIEQAKRDAADQVKIAKAEYEAMLTNYIVYGLGTIGMLLFIIGLVMKSPTFIITGISLIGSAFSFATLPTYVIWIIMGLFFCVMGYMYIRKNATSSTNKQSKQAEDKGEPSA